MYPFNQEEIDYYLPSGKDSGKGELWRSSRRKYIRISRL
jgi:hypothetical protein